MKKVGLAILLFAFGVGASQVKPDYKVMRLGQDTVAIFCTNGADATLVKNPQFGLLIVSCGIHMEAK